LEASGDILRDPEAPAVHPIALEEQQTAHNQNTAKLRIKNTCGDMALDPTFHPPPLPKRVFNILKMSNDPFQ